MTSRKELKKQRIIRHKKQKDVIYSTYIPLLLDDDFTIFSKDHKKFKVTIPTYFVCDKLEKKEMLDYFPDLTCELSNCIYTNWKTISYCIHSFLLINRIITESKILHELAQYIKDYCISVYIHKIQVNLSLKDKYMHKVHMLEIDEIFRRYRK